MGSNPQLHLWLVFLMRVSIVCLLPPSLNSSLSPSLPPFFPPPLPPSKCSVCSNDIIQTFIIVSYSVAICMTSPSTTSSELWGRHANNSHCASSSWKHECLLLTCTHTCTHTCFAVTLTADHLHCLGWSGMTC